VEAYRKIRNTCRFLLGNLYDFDPGRDAVPPERMPELDRWALHQCEQLLGRAREAYEGYQFQRVFQSLHHFCVVTMSAFYLDILKDRLYTSSPGSPLRRSAQTVLHRVLDTLALLMAPVLSFTAEEVWQHARGRADGSALTGSIHLEEFPAPLSLPAEPDLAARWERLALVREDVLRRLEVARGELGIGNSLEAAVTLEARGDWGALLARYESDLPSLFIVSRVDLGPAGPAAHPAERAAGVSIAVRKAPGEKCERCWNYREDRGADAEFPTLCGRCVPVVREAQARRPS
jgi:isoleucyl-tRNA synthetase